MPNLGIASEYAILSGDSITSADFVNCKGLVGTTTLVSDLIFSDDSVYENSTGTVDSALQDALDFFTILNSGTGTLLSTMLNGDSLVSGTYVINGNAFLNNNLNFYGDSNSVIIIIVNGSLNIDSGANCRLFNIGPRNIFWIVNDDIVFNGFSYVYGNFMSSDDISSNNSITGIFSFISLNGKVSLSGNSVIKRSFISNSNQLTNYANSSASYPCTSFFNEGGNSNDQAHDICTDIYGNYYLTGLFSSPSTFNGNGSGGSSTFNSNGAFIAKYNSTGALLWARNINNSSGFRVRVDPLTNDVVILGIYFGSISISGIILNSLPNSNTYTAFVARYSSNGNILWAQNIGLLSTGFGIPYLPIHSVGLDVDKLGNVYSYAYLNTTITVGVVGIPQTFNNSNSHTGLLLKLAPNGSVIWGVTGGFYANAVEVDDNFNVFFTGVSPNSVTQFDSHNSPTSISMSNSPFVGQCIGMYNQSGIIQWVQSVKPTTNNSSFCYTDLKSDCFGNCYSIGHTYGNSNVLTSANGNSYNLGQNRKLIVKYNANGNVIWYGEFEGLVESIGKIDKDADGNIYFSGSVSPGWDAFHATAFATSFSSTEIYVAKLNNLGMLMNVDYYGGSSSHDYALSLAINVFNQQSYITGLFNGTSSIGNSLTSQNNDIFVAECITPTIIFPINAGSDVTVCKYVSVNLTGTGIGPYQWYENGIIIPGATTQNLTVTPLITSTYTFQAYGPDGCQYSDHVVVNVDQGCCFIPGIQSYTNPTFGSTVTNQTFIINGTATIQGSVTFSGCTVLMGPNSIIELAAGSTFSLDATLIQACSDMWQGISMTGLGSEFASDNSSHIEDAINAVFAPDPRAINIRNTTFDRNLVSINLNNGNYTTFAISGNSFLCSGGYSLHFPNNGQRSSAHILLNGVQNITIGDPGSVSNLFDNADAGISCNLSGMAVYNNIFQNITFNTVTNLAAAGILCIQGPNVTIGGINPNESNTFTSNFYAIEIIASHTVNIVKNNFSNCGVGVFPLFNFYGIINITDDNTMTNMASGISAIWNPHASFSFTDNHIQIDNYLNQQTNGIGIAEIYSLWGSSSATVQRNVIHSEGYYGFFLRNSANGFFENNRVYMDQFFPPDEVYGFRMDNSFYNTLTCNEVDATYYSAGDNGQNKRGFTLFDSPNNTIDCNTSDKNEIGFQFMGNNATTNINGNEMHEGGVGLALGDVNNYVASSIDNLVANGTILPGNKWYNNSFDTYNYQQSGVPALWTQNPSGNPDYPSVNSSIGGPSIVPFVQPSYSLFACPTCNIPLFTFSGNDSVQFDINMAEQIAQSQLPIMNADAVTAWKAMRQLFEELDRNQDLMDSSAVLELFYDSLKNETIGKLALVKRLILQTTDSAVYNNLSLLQSIVDSATTINNSIIALVLPEFNEKLVNTIYLNSIAVKRYILNQNEISDLLMVANQCIYEGGPAVLSARVFLNSQYPFLYFDDASFCNAGINRFADQSNNQNKSDFIKCYPNPASDNLLVEFKVETESVLYVYDNTGRQVISMSINVNNHFINLDVSKLSNGYYFFRIANQNSSLTGKFDIKK